MLGIKSLKKTGSNLWLDGQRTVDEEVGIAFLAVYTKCFKLSRALVFHLCMHEVVGSGYAVFLY